MSEAIAKVRIHGSLWEPWERRGDESSQAWEAFQAFLMHDPPSERTLRKAAETVGKSTTQIGEWSTKYEWIERGRLYDSHVFKVGQRARDKVAAASAAKWERRKNESREKFWSVGEKLLSQAELMLASPLTTRRVKKDGKTIVEEAAKWSQMTAVGFIKLASELQSGAIADALDDDGFDPETATPEECQDYLARMKLRNAEVRKLTGPTGDSA